MHTIKWGIIGCGNVTEVKSGPGLQKAQGSELVAVMRRNGELAKDYAKRHQVPKWYDDAQKLIDDPQVDAIYIATHPDTHREYTLQAVKAGKPVYCEKPLGISYAQSREMVTFCKEKNVPLFSAYYRRALPKYIQIKNIIESEILGDIRYVSVEMHQSLQEEDRKNGGSWRVDPSLSGGGRFIDIGSHALDLLNWYFGPITQAQGSAVNQSKVYEAEDIVCGSWMTESNILGSGIWCFNTFKDEDWTTICGSEAQLSYSVLNIEEPIVLRTRAGIQKLEVPKAPDHVAQMLIQTVVDELLGKGSCPSTGETGMQTDWVMEKLQGR